MGQEALSSALSSLSDEEKEGLKKQESVGLTREAALCYNPSFSLVVLRRAKAARLVFFTALSSSSRTVCCRGM